MARHKKNVRKRRKRKLIVFVIELIVLALILAMLYFYSKLDMIDTQQVDQNKVKVNKVTEETEQTFQGYTTIAIFGLDNRTQGVYEAGNSDVIMVMNINNDTREMSLVSVYRDTYLNVADAESDELMFRKCNSAYQKGGPERAITMLNRNLDLEIDNYVSVDFRAVANAIDILGGVDIEIESNAELGYLNEYIDANNGILGTDSPMLTSTGMQTLDGVQAVAYSRIRYTAGGDFKRAERQRRVFSQMVEKAKKAKLSQVNELIEAVFPQIQTDLSKKNMLSMASAMIGYDMAYSSGFPMDKTTATPSKSIGSIDVPCTLESNVVALHNQLFGTENYEPSETVKKYSEHIIKVTGIREDDAEQDQFSKADDFTGKSMNTQDEQSEDGEE